MTIFDNSAQRAVFLVQVSDDPLPPILKRYIERFDCQDEQSILRAADFYAQFIEGHPCDHPNCKITDNAFAWYTNQIESSRTYNLNPEYYFDSITQVATHIKTDKPCDCKMEWNLTGTILACPICGLDGT